MRRMRKETVEIEPLRMKSPVKFKLEGILTFT
jgi:hypothetical protein